MSLSRNYCCCIFLPLKMINNYRCRLPAKTYSMMVVYLRWPGFFLKILCFLTISNIIPLASISYIRPISFRFYRSAYIIFLMAGRSKSGNYVYITSVVTLLIRAVSIRRVWRVLTYRLRCKKLSNQCFPMPVAELPTRGIWLVNIWIYIYVGIRLKVFCI